ncbi:hypothetical protein NDA07_13965 [Microcoleus vaginatus DQ-U2]|uniref:hypothetical protein n=1 Tax=Microcoleus vaginatus TaxID=119532 RepID=UPI001688FAEB|nr:hypothetical protein [Microcoleus sp. FACHB-DQ6]
MPTPLFHPLVPGASLPGDWYHGSIPTNIEVGENSVIDSSFCFKHYYAAGSVGLRVGSNVTIWRASLAVDADAVIEIGDYCYIADASLVCSARITLGAHVMVAGRVTIVDSDFHPIAPAARLIDTIALSPIGDRQRRPPIEILPVVIEDDVWIGYNATILKGVRVGAGAAIAHYRSIAVIKSSIRIVVLGYIVRGPLGGLVWHHLQYVMGLAALGHDVYFLEDSDDYPSCYDPVRDIVDTNPTYGLGVLADTFARVGLGERWAYYDAHSSQWFGSCANCILEICSTADLLLNLSGVNPLRPWLMTIPYRALVDTDPVFTQLRHLYDPVANKQALAHTSFFSFGENINAPWCLIPQDGLPWQPTRQPVVLDAWAVTPGSVQGKFTTVMQWDSYRAREHAGQHYGMKSESFTPYINLPQQTNAIFELALGSASAPRELLANQGWLVRDSREPTKTPWIYQSYIQQSKAEFSVAKHGYVVSCNGWFSERSATYLASGRPVVIQDTGFSKWLETQAGVLPFNTPEEALAGIDEINRRYEFHCQAAREIAAEYFAASKVLPHLLERAL